LLEAALQHCHISLSSTEENLQSYEKIQETWAAAAHRPFSIWKRKAHIAKQKLKRGAGRNHTKAITRFQLQPLQGTPQEASSKI
jgi:hypothetical protein